MHKNHLKKQAGEKLATLKDQLNQHTLDVDLSLADVQQLLNVLHEAEKTLTVLEYFLRQNELSGELNMHMMVMESALSIDDSQNKKHTDEQPQTKAEEVIEREADKNLSSTTNENTATFGQQKKIELSINDRFRMINELFQQNKLEFGVALEQLNAAKSWDDAKNYLTSLAGLYNWDNENEIVKTFYRVVQKRFS